MDLFAILTGIDNTTQVSDSLIFGLVVVVGITFFIGFLIGLVTDELY